METVAVAHRAGNELSALRQAEAAGAQLIEVDVHLFHSRLEARHLKTVGPLRLYWDRWEVRPPSTPIVAFEELLASTDHPLLIDLKGGAGSLGGRVAEAVEGRAGTTWICSRRWRHLEPLRGRPGLAVVASVGSASQLARLLRRYGPGDLDGVSINRGLLEPGVIDQLRRRTDLVLTWRVNDLTVAADLYRRGVRGFISDRYDLLGSLAALGAAHEQPSQRPASGNPPAEHGQPGAGDGIDHEVVGGGDDGQGHGRGQRDGGAA